MSILDLQGMEAPLPQTGGGGNSSTSNHDSCPSAFSVTLCDHNSTVSLLLCK